MRDDLAESVLARVMEWGPAELAQKGADLQAMAQSKYDEYEGYNAGVRFLESLVGWLSQFTDRTERAIAVEFVLRDLVFISRAELDHAVQTVYPDFVRPLLARLTAKELGLPPHRIRDVTQAKEFRRLQRSTLVLGLADGARLDRLRRTSAELSHEQFFLTPEVGDAPLERAVEKLRSELGDEHRGGFQVVLLVDDFSGSGYTMLRREDEGDRWDGKLWKAHERMSKLQPEGIIADDAEVAVVLYVASREAEAWLREALKESGLGWRLHVVQSLGDIGVHGDPITAVGETYFDDVVMDGNLRKGLERCDEPEPWLGFACAALPVVLSHNCPNNSINLLWAEAAARDGRPIRALFPRRARHGTTTP